MLIRDLTLDDHEASARLGGEAFGRPAAHEYQSRWHGERIPTCGIAGVVVAAEHRGKGLLRPLSAGRTPTIGCGTRCSV